MSVTFLDPRAEPSRPIEAYDAALLDPNTPAAIALLANGFPDSVAFLDHVERALLCVAPPGTIVRRYAKPNASAPANSQTIDAIVAECQAIVTAYGH